MAPAVSKEPFTVALRVDGTDPLDHCCRLPPLGSDRTSVSVRDWLIAVAFPPSLPVALTVVLPVTVPLGDTDSDDAARAGEAASATIEPPIPMTMPARPNLCAARLITCPPNLSASSTTRS